MWRQSILGVLILATAAVGEDTAPKPGTYYKYGQLGVRKTEINGTRIDLTFKPQDEQFHWCPGIKVQSTKKATVVTFVRCKTSRSCGIDKKAAIGKRLLRTISIDSNGLDVYVRNGPKKFKRIYKSPNSKMKSCSQAKSKSKGKTKPTTKTTKGSGKRTAAVLHPADKHILRREVSNHQFQPAE